MWFEVAVGSFPVTSVCLLRPGLTGFLIRVAGRLSWAPEAAAPVTGPRKPLLNVPGAFDTWSSVSVFH